MSEEMKFSLERQEIKVSIEGKDKEGNDETKTYTLKEADGFAAIQYRNRIMEAIRPSAEGQPTAYKGFAEIEPLLVSLCLFNEDDKPVSISMIKGWPSRIQKALFNKVKDMSDLDETAESDKVKNEQSDTTDG